MIISDLLLDSQDYYFSTDYRTNGDTDYQGNTTTKKVYANDYKYLHIRSWLDITFYNTAFSTFEKVIIAQTEVDNSTNQGLNGMTIQTIGYSCLLNTKWKHIIQTRTHM